MTKRRAFLVVDLAFGDCGKGTIVDFLARDCDAHTVVRFNGGPQAGHNVVTDDGRHHTFSQFGAGTFVPKVRTFLSQHMLVEPYALLNEAAHLSALGVHDAFDRLDIDGRCLVIMPPQQAANRLRERARGANAHGTCGLGIGEAVGDAMEHSEVSLHADELADGRIVRARLLGCVELKRRQLNDSISSLRHDSRAQADIETILQPAWIEAAIETYAAVARRARIVDPEQAKEILRRSGNMIFEGAQGVLLDEAYGFHPHKTWSDTTFAN